MRRPTTRTLIVASLLTWGCGEAIDSEIEPGEFRAFEPDSYWGEVWCDADESGCWARVATDDDLIVAVKSGCELSAMVQQGTLTPTTGGWVSTCAPGEKPTVPPDVACFSKGPAVHCYAGDDGWFARAMPACEATGGWIASSWPEGSCDADGSEGEHGYDIVFAMADNLGRALVGSEAYNVRPLCWLDSIDTVAVDPYECPEGQV